MSERGKGREGGRVNSSDKVREVGKDGWEGKRRRY